MRASRRKLLTCIHFDKVTISRNGWKAMPRVSMSVEFVLAVGAVVLVLSLGSFGLAEDSCMHCGKIPKSVSAQPTNSSSNQNFWTPERLREAQPTEMPYASESVLSEKDTKLDIAPVMDGASAKPEEKMNETAECGSAQHRLELDVGHESTIKCGETSVGRTKP